MTADLSPAQAARLEAIEAAPYAEEAAVERVARALALSHGVDYDQPLTEKIGTRDHYRRLAVAAIDVMRGATDDGAIGRVLELHASDGTEPEACDYCGDPYPCPTVRAVGAPATAEGDDRG